MHTLNSTQNKLGMINTFSVKRLRASLSPKNLILYIFVSSFEQCIAIFSSLVVIIILLVITVVGKYFTITSHSVVDDISSRIIKYFFPSKRPAKLSPLASSLLAPSCVAKLPRATPAGPLFGCLNSHFSHFAQISISSRISIWVTKRG